LYLNNYAPKHFSAEKTTLLCLLYLAVAFTPAQTKGQVAASDSVYHLFARITGRSDHMPVQFAHIINRTTGHGNISDTLGFFTILVHPADIISISAIGYFNYSFQVTGSLLTPTSTQNIELTPRSYPIEPVSVNPL
jgi:hypothetical protein